jgi:hypothetical protein
MESNTYKEYSIAKGRHRSKWIPTVLPRVDNMKIDAIFDSTCWHKPEVIEYSGINKLIGFTQAFWFPHYRSLRIGWQPDSIRENVIKLYIYTYNSKKRFSKSVYVKRYVCDVSTCTPFTINIAKVDKGRIEIGIKIHDYNKRIAIMDNSIPHRYCFLLNPYFGGKSKAPHDMCIGLNYTLNK